MTPPPNGFFRSVSFWLQTGILAISVGLAGFALHRDSEFQEVKWRLTQHEMLPWHGEAARRYERQDTRQEALEKEQVRLSGRVGSLEDQIKALREELQRVRR